MFTDLFQKSILGRWLMVLYHLYRESRLGHLIDRLDTLFNHLMDGSCLMRWLCREGVVARAWPESLLCRILELLINLPGRILHWLYRLLRPAMENSFFAGLAFEAGEETSIAQFWLIALLWCIPYSRWNNAYSLLGCMMLLALFYIGSMRSNRTLDLKATGFYPLIILASMVLAVKFSYRPALSSRFLIYHLSAALCVLVTVSAVRSASDLKRLCAGGSICVAVSSLYGVYQRIQGVEVNASYVDLTLNADMPGRVMSYFDNPNTFAEVLVLLLPLVVALILCSDHLLSRLAACGIFAVGVLALGMTYSRASWIGFACAMVVLIFLWRPKLIPFFLLACIVCIPLLPSSIFNRILTITNLNDSSTSSRVPLYEASFKVLQISPVSGAGLGTAAVQRFIKDHNLYFERAPYVHSHNFYLQVWLEAGLLGVLGLVSSLLWNIKRAARAVRHCGASASRTITCAAAAALCGMMVNGLADYPWNYPRVMFIFWFVFAVALSGTKLCTSDC